MLPYALPAASPTNAAGDVVVAIDGRPVRSLFDLTSLLDERNVGDTVEVRRHTLGLACASKSSSFRLHSGWL